jgi:hypothetical protein
MNCASDYLWSLEEVIALLTWKSTDKKVKFLGILCLLLLSNTEAWSAPSLKIDPIPGLTAPSASDALKVRKIQNLALGWWMRNKRILANETLYVVGYFSIFRPIKDFAATKDTIWEVRVNASFVPSGVVWVNENNSKVIGLGGNQNQF